MRDIKQEIKENRKHSKEENNHISTEIKTFREETYHFNKWLISIGLTTILSFLGIAITVILNFY